MGQSNYNKSAIKAKENGTSGNGHLETPYKVALGVICAVVVACLIFAILVSTHVINCTNTSTLLAESVNGDSVYYTYITNSEGTGYEYIYYVIDENGKRMDCHYSEALADVCYYDENGEEKVYMVEYGSLGDSVDGKTLYMASSVNGLYGAGTLSYYFFDENGERVDCKLSEDGTQLFYTDAEGNEKEFVLALAASASDVSASDVSGTDVSAADVSAADAA